MVTANKDNEVIQMRTRWLGILLLIVVTTSGCWPHLSFVGGATYSVKLMGVVHGALEDVLPTSLVIYSGDELRRQVVPVGSDGRFSVNWTTTRRHGPWTLEFQIPQHHPIQMAVSADESLLQLDFQTYAGLLVSGTLDYQLPQASLSVAGAGEAFRTSGLVETQQWPLDERRSIVLKASSGEPLRPWEKHGTVRYYPHANLWSLSDLSENEAQEAYMALSQDPEVQWLDWNAPVFASAMRQPNDPLFQEQWHYDLIYLPHAWHITTGRPQPPVRIGILDTLADGGHPDLQANLLRVNSLTSSTQPQHHGTHVAGIIGATTNNNRGVAGTIWSADLRSYGVLNGGGTDAILAEGLALAASEGAQIMNLSLGGRSDLPASLTSIQNAHAQGVTIIAAAGNVSGSNCGLGASEPYCTLFPAAYGEVIAVGAVEVDGQGRPQVASYSLLGPDNEPVLLFAPGGTRGGPSILSTTTAGGYTEDLGTSMAAPLVSGIVGLLLSVEGGLTPTAIWERLYKTGIGLPFDHHPRRMVNAYAAVTQSYLHRAWIGFEALTGAHAGLIYWAEAGPDRTFDGSLPPGEYALTARIPVTGSSHWIFSERVSIPDTDSIAIEFRLE